MIIFNEILKHFKGELKGKRIAIWGLSFKPNTDDMREAPALVVISKLLEAGATVKAYDPVAMQETQHKIGNKILYANDMYEAANDADALVLMTEWQEFRVINYKMLAKILKSKVVFDGRNIYEPTEMTEEGFTYYSIGRKAVNP